MNMELSIPVWVPPMIRELKANNNWLKGERTVTVTPELIDLFVDMSSDDNPLHTSSEHARRRRLPDRIAHLALIYSILPRLMQPLTRVIFTEMEVWEPKLGEMEMMRPVACGSVLSGEVSVAGLFPRSHRSCDIHFGFRLYLEGSARELCAEGKRLIHCRPKMMK